MLNMVDICAKVLVFLGYDEIRTCIFGVCRNLLVFFVLV